MSGLGTYKAEPRQKQHIHRALQHLWRGVPLTHGSLQ